MPGWWPALTHYVAGMQTAWHAFAVWGRPAHPRLRVCFAMLAGLAPLQRERLVARGGLAASDADVFLEVSSYGARAVDAMLREVGVDRLVHGSDRPVSSPVDLPLGEAVRHGAAGPQSVPIPAPDASAGRRMTAVALTHDLDRDELRELVAEIAADPERWSSLVRHGTAERAFEQLWRDDHVDVWVISWMQRERHGFHDHDVSRGAVAVVEGEVIEERLVVGGPSLELHHPAGDCVRFRRIARPSHASGLRHTGGVDPCVLAAAVADGVLRGRARWHAAA